MTEYERIVKETVYEKLKEKVRGKVSCWVRDDELHIKVTMIDTKYEVVVEDLANRVVRGLNTDLIVYDFCKSYRRYIMGGYFR